MRVFFASCGVSVRKKVLRSFPEANLARLAPTRGGGNGGGLRIRREDFLNCLDFCLKLSLHVVEQRSQPKQAGEKPGYNALRRRALRSGFGSLPQGGRVLAIISNLAQQQRSARAGFYAQFFPQCSFATFVLSYRAHAIARKIVQSHHFLMRTLVSTVQSQTAFSVFNACFVLPALSAIAHQFFED